MYRRVRVLVFLFERSSWRYQSDIPQFHSPRLPPSLYPFAVFSFLQQRQSLVLFRSIFTKTLKSNPILICFIFFFFSPHLLSPPRTFSTISNKTTTTKKKINHTALTHCCYNGLKHDLRPSPNPRTPRPPIPLPSLPILLLLLATTWAGAASRIHNQYG